MAACDQGVNGPVPVSKSVGPSGGRLSLPGIELVIPAGALSASVTISIIPLDTAPPDPYVPATALYYLDPEALTFQKPVEVKLTIAEGVVNPSVFWEKPIGQGFDNVGGTVEATPITASNTHFSEVFAGQGPAQLASSAVVDIGSIKVGAASAASTVTVTVTNNGGLASGPITLGVGGTNASEFQVATTTCDGTALPPDGTCSAEIVFRPTSTGAKAATLNVNADPGGPLAVILTAVGLPDLSLAPASHDFGPIMIGQSSAATTFTVTNGSTQTGVLAVTITDANPVDFTLGTNTCAGAQLAPLTTCTIDVRFAPTVAGNRSATVTITGSPGGTVTSGLAGSGTH
ncbi:hypothetical protein BH11MYX3_BH11MYX3_23630 [soil metagenome]